MEKSRFWSWLGLVALLVYGGLFLFVAISHLLYPGFTEPMEGNALQHIERAARGLPLYPQPDGEFIALAYLPFYYFASVPFYYLFGDSLAAPRLLSTLAALASGWLIWLITRRESGERPAAHLAAAFYFSGYRIMDGYLTCGLPDSLLLFWLLSGWYFLAYGRRWWHDYLWLAAFTLAFWTKQQGALFFAAAMIYALFLRPAPVAGESRLPRGALLAFMLLGGPALYYFYGPALGGRFFFHTLYVPAHWEKSILTALARTVFALFCFVPFAALLGACGLHGGGRGRWRQPLIYFTLTALAIGVYTMSSTGSSNNHYIPFVCGLAILAALGAWRIMRGARPVWIKPALAAVCLGAALLSSLALKFYQNHDVPFYLPLVFLAVWIAYLRAARHEWPPSGQAALLVGVLAVAQFAVAFYCPPDYLPGRNYRAQLAELRAELGQLDGPVIWANYGNAPQALTGRKLATAPSWIALEDVMRLTNADEKTPPDLSMLRERLQRCGKLYLLADGPLQNIPGWGTLAADFELVKNYHEKFADVPQIAIHWYSGRSYPQHLYRLRATPTNYAPAGNAPGQPAP